jgi:hypothetical protein
MSLIARVGEQKARLAVADVLSRSRLEELAIRAQKDNSVLPVILHPDEKLDVSFVLSLVQRMIFAGMPLNLLNHFNQSIFVALKERVAPGNVQSAVHVLLKRDAMLRRRFHQINGERMQTILSNPNAPLL